MVKKRILAVRLQPNSWILNDDTGRIGLLTCDPSDHPSRSGAPWTLLSRDSSQSFDNSHDLEKHLNARISWQEEAVTEQPEPDQLVHNLPIKHTQAVDILLEPRVSYKRTISSNTRFAAGYWILKFATGWSGSLSPKCDTLEEYEHQGPFADKLEMNTLLAQKNVIFHKTQGGAT